jgi:hypothetical protein
VLNVYGAGQLVIEEGLMPPRSGARVLQIADALFGGAARVFDDGSIAAYAIAGGAALPRAMWLDTGWSYLERLGERGADQRMLRWRWMSERARLGIAAPAPSQVRVRLTAVAFGQPRRLALRLGATAIATWTIARDRSEIVTPVFAVPAGVSFVELIALDGASPAGEDPRRLSIALFGAELVLGP